MRFIFYFVCFPFFALAQDSTLLFNVQRLNLQTSSSPSSRFDQGKNVINLQTQFSYSKFSDPQVNNRFLDLSYSTHLSHHSFAIQFTHHSTLNYLFTQSVGLQYAYTIKLPAFLFGKNAAFIPGLGISYNKRTLDFSQFRFGDQIDDRIGFINPTAEYPVNEKYHYPNFQLSSLLRNKHYFIHYQLQNFLEPVISFQPPRAPTPELRLHRTQQLDFGARFVGTNYLSLWLTGSLFYSHNKSSQGIGIYASSFHKIIAGYSYLQGISTITGGYYASRLRIIMRYQTNLGSTVPFFQFGTYSAGIATAIGKQ